MEIRTNSGGWGRLLSAGEFLLGAGMEKAGGTQHFSSRQREGINEDIKAYSLRSIVGGRTG